MRTLVSSRSEPDRGHLYGRLSSRVWTPRSNPSPRRGPYMQNKKTQLYSKWFKAATLRVRKRFTFAETVYLFKSRKAARDVESKMKGFVLVSHSARAGARSCLSDESCRSCRRFVSG